MKLTLSVALQTGAGSTLPPAIAISLTGVVVRSMVAVTVPAERDVSDGEPVGPLPGRLQAHLAAPVQRAKPHPVESVPASS